MSCIVIHLKEISIRLRSDEDENTTTVISLCLSSIPSTGHHQLHWCVVGLNTVFHSSYHTDSSCRFIGPLHTLVL